MDTEKPVRPAEGALLRDARTARGMSIEQAARAAGYSGSRWRQIESGYATVEAGVYRAIKARPDTLATMARAVGITPDQLDRAGRPDAAEHLRLLEHTPSPDTPESPVRVVTVSHRDSLARAFIGMVGKADDRTAQMAYAAAIAALREAGIPVPEEPEFPGRRNTGDDHPQ